MDKLTLTKNEFVNYKKLLQKKYRHQYKKFIIEGIHLIEEAIKTNNLLVIVTSNTNFKNKKVDVKYCTQFQIEQLTTTKTAQEIIGICRFFEYCNEKINDSNVLVLNKINDPGNLGTIIRTANAFNFNTIFVEGVDIYNSKVLRSTQGAIFHTKLINVNNTKETLIKLKNNNYFLIGTHLNNESKKVEELNLSNKNIALILGNESHGIDNDLVKLFDQNVCIDINFNSLNVAIAGAILMEKIYSMTKK